MASSSSATRAQLEALLRTRHLDRTLVSATDVPPPETIAPVGLPAIDAHLKGGFPRGQFSEIVGRRSAGRTTVLHAVLASAIARGEFVALVDSLDTFDPPSAADAGVDLRRLLWVRGPSITQGLVGNSLGGLLDRACERALKSFNLILQAGGSGPSTLAVLDLAEIPPPALRRIPFITWLRLQRLLEGSQSVGLLIADISLGRSARGITLQLTSPLPASPPLRSVQTSPWQPPVLRLEVKR